MSACPCCTELQSLKTSLWDVMRFRELSIPQRGSDHDRIVMGLCNAIDRTAAVREEALRESRAACEAALLRYADRADAIGLKPDVATTARWLAEHMAELIANPSTGRVA